MASYRATSVPKSSRLNVPEATRLVTPAPSTKTSPTHRNLLWFYTNLNKRGIALNLESADGHGIFKRLVKTAHEVSSERQPNALTPLRKVLQFNQEEYPVKGGHNHDDDG